MRRSVFNRIVLVFLIITMLLSFFKFSIVKAEWTDGVYTEIEVNKDADIGRDDTGAAEKIQKILTIIAVIFKIVAVATGIVILIALAVKYMMAAPGDRADIKKSMIPFVIGAFVLFASSGIVDMLIRFSAQLSS